MIDESLNLPNKVEDIYGNVISGKIILEIVLITFNIEFTFILFSDI